PEFSGSKCRATSFFLEEGEQPRHLLPVRLPAVLAYLEGLRVAHLLCLLLAVPVAELLAVPLCQRLVASGETGTDLPAPLALFRRVLRNQVRRAVRPALVEL